MAVVVGREVIAVGGVANDPHVDPISAPDVLRNGSRSAGEEVLRGRPTAWVGNVGISGIGGVPILVDEIPEILGSEEEDLRGGTVTGTDGSGIEIVESGGLSLTEIGKAEIDEIVARGDCSTGEDVIFAVVEDDGRVLECGEVVRVGFRSNERAA
jgi:hypothetical protein